MNYARVAELVDARDLKSLDQKSCGFDSRLAHQCGIWNYCLELNILMENGISSTIRVPKT